MNTILDKLKALDKLSMYRYPSLSIDPHTYSFDVLEDRVLLLNIKKGHSDVGVFTPFMKNSSLYIPYHMLVFLEPVLGKINWDRTLFHNKIPKNTFFKSLNKGSVSSM